MVSVTPQPGGARAGGNPPRILHRNYFSTRLLWTSFHASAKAREIEDAHHGVATFDIEHESYVLSAIVSAATFLEATINEFFQDAHDGHGLKDDGYLAAVTPETIHAMAVTWTGTDSGFKLNALEKWQLLLVFAGHDPLHRGGAPYQDAQEVMRLRNTIVHYRPEHVAVGEAHKIEKSLRGSFAENALMSGSGNPWWPSHCLGHGCAEWSAQSALALADRVCAEVGINPNYRRVADSGWFGKTPGSWAT